jgi:multicomponent Na+:H+ antiporter subunit A
VPTEVLLGVGVVLVTGTALVPLLLGNSVLEHHTWSYDDPVLGTVKWTSALFFDTGILLIVVGVVATIIEILGSESDPDLPPVAQPDEDRP